jgi:hypothetical protein
MFHGGGMRSQYDRPITRGAKAGFEKRNHGLKMNNIIHKKRERKQPERYGAGVCHGYPDYYFVGGGLNLYRVGRTFLPGGQTDVCFDRQIYPGNGTILNFQMTGTRAGDAAAANAIKGWMATPGGYTWHHKRDFVVAGLGGRCTMQLILSNCHNHIFHHGAVSQWNAQYPFNLYA